MTRAGCRAAARIIALAVVMLGAPWPGGFLDTARAVIEQRGYPDDVSAGIGAVLRIVNNDTVVTQIIPGGPADKDGRLKVNDRIAAVAQGNGAFQDCTTLSLENTVEMIRGRKGTTVRLQVIAAGAPVAAQPKVISIVRDLVKLNGQAGQGVPGVQFGPGVQIGPGVLVVPGVQAAPAGAAAKIVAPAVPAGQAVAQASPTASPAAKQDEGPQLSPEKEAKMDEITKKMDEAKRKLLLDSMGKTVADLAQATGLNDNGKKALNDAAAKAVDESIRNSDTAMKGRLRVELKSIPDGQWALVLSQVESQLASGATWAVSQQKEFPADEPAWTDALKQTLTPAQAAAWASAEGSRKQAAEAEIGDFLKGEASFCAQMEMRQLDAAVTQVQMDLNLPDDQLGKVKDLEKTMANQFGEKGRAAAEKGLLAMGEEERKTMLTQRGYYEWLPQVTRDGWEEGLAKLLTPDKMKRLETAKADRNKTQAQVMGRMIVALRDERIAFTAAQRAKLEPIAVRLAENSPGLQADGNGGMNYSRSSFYSAASGDQEDAIKGILDPIQWQHWRELSALKDVQDGNVYMDTSFQLPAEGEASKPEAAPEPETTENAISDYLADKAAAERQTVLGATLLRAEDAARVAHLTPEVTERLKTAARGSAEYYLNGWYMSVEQMLRSQVGDATPDSIKQKLGSIPNYQFQEGLLRNGAMQSGGGGQTLWDNAVKAALSPDQAKAWKQEVDGRSAYEQKAIGGMIVWAFSQRVGLSPDQTAKLQPMVTKILADYSEDIGNFFSNGGVWYLQSFEMYLPICGIPDKELKGVLSEEQMDRWNRCDEHSNASMYWTAIAQNHKARGGVQ